MKKGILYLLTSLGLFGADATLTWDANLNGTSGYKLYVGTVPGIYYQSNIVTGITNTSSSFSNLTAGKYYFAVSAYLDLPPSTNVLESPLSNPATLTIFPNVPNNLRITRTNLTSIWIEFPLNPNLPWQVQSKTNLSDPWRVVVDGMSGFMACNLLIDWRDPMRFYRVFPPSN